MIPLEAVSFEVGLNVRLLKILRSQLFTEVSLLFNFFFVLKYFNF